MEADFDSEFCGLFGSGLISDGGDNSFQNWIQHTVRR